MSENQSALRKALEVNRAPNIYGAFAEIGAGQEVARFFFQAGKASQTIAKTISAYDMIYSDEIYGKETSGRYVCESRLIKMLTKEFSLLHRRLDQVRGNNTCFFALANTVATGDQKKKFSHGWMGIRFQTDPMGPENEIVLHLRMLDRYRLQQQETLGILGVNLVHTAFFRIKDADKIIDSLTENIKAGQLAIDYLRVSGPAFAHVNNHLLNLELVRKGLSEVALFGPDQKILTLSDELYQKSVLIQRGTYRPVTVTHLDVFEKGIEQFKKDFPEEKKNLQVFFEMTMNPLSKDKISSDQEYLDRVEALCSIGHKVMVSNFSLFYRLKHFLRGYTEKPMVLIMGASYLDLLLDSVHYADLEGGLLEGLGKLLDEKTRLFIYPHKTDMSCMTTKTFFPAPKVLKIYQHFLEQQQIKDISGCDDISEYLHSEDVRKLITAKDKRWEKLVPPSVRELILQKKIFSYF